MDRSFPEIIKIGEIFEECLNKGSIISMDSLQTTNKVVQSGGTTKNNKKIKIGEVMIVQHSESILSYQTLVSPPSCYPQTPKSYPVSL